MTLRAPPRWPPLVARLLGAVCIVASVYTHSYEDRSRSQMHAVEAQIARAQGDAKVYAELRLALEDARTEFSYWRRLSIGFLLAGIILVVGGAIAARLQRAHETGTWFVTDEKPPE